MKPLIGVLIELNSTLNNFSGFLILLSGLLEIVEPIILQLQITFHLLDYRGCKGTE